MQVDAVCFQEGQEQIFVMFFFSCSLMEPVWLDSKTFLPVPYTWENLVFIHFTYFALSHLCSFT